MRIHITETTNKLQQLGQAPKKIKGDDKERRRILQRWCDRQDIVPVFEENGEVLY